MTIQEKRRRRLKIFALSLLALLVVGAGAYIVRRQIIDAKLKVARDEGMVALKNGDWYDALHKIGKYLQHNEKDLDATFAYAKARLQVEEPDGAHLVEAMRLLRQVSDRRPDDQESQDLLLETYLQAGFQTEALTLAESMLRSDPNHVAAVRGKAVALTALSRYGEAMKTAQRYNDLRPTEMAEQVLTLELMTRAGEKPESIVRRAVALRAAHVDDSRFAMLLAIAHAQAGDRENAVKEATIAAQNPPADPTAVALLVDQLDRLGLFTQSLAVVDRQEAVGSSRLQSLLIAKLYQAERYGEVVRRLVGLNAALSNTPPQTAALYALSLAQEGKTGDAKAVAEALADRPRDLTANAWGRAVRGMLATDAKPTALLADSEDLLRRLPNNPYILMWLGELHWRIGDTQTAIAHWQRVAIVAPAWFKPQVRLAEAMGATQRWQAAIDAAQEARRRAPDRVEPLVSLILAATPGTRGTSDDRRAAIDLLGLVDQALERNPREQRILPCRVELLVRCDRQGDALAAVKALLAREPAPELATLLALGEVCRQHLPEVEQSCYDLAAAAHGNSPLLALAQARSAAARGNPAEGRRFFETVSASEKSRDPLGWQLTWAKYLDQIGAPEAQEAWVSLGETAVDDPQILWQALAARAVQANTDFLDRTLQRLSKLVGQGSVAWKFARAQWLLRGQRSDKEMVEAMTILQEIVHAIPDLLPARLMLADCMEKTGNRVGAIEQLTMSTSLQPDAPALQLQLARLYQSQSDFAKAAASLEKVTAAASASPADRRAAAALWARQGDIDRAIKIMQEVYGPDVRETPSDALLASLYSLRGEWDMADAAYRRLLKEPDAAVIRAAAAYFASRRQLRDAEAALALLDRPEISPAARSRVRAEFFWRQGDSRQALTHARAAVEADSTSVEGWSQYLTYLIYTGNAETVASALTSAAQACPAHAPFKAMRERMALVRLATQSELLRPLGAALLQDDSGAAAAALQIASADGGMMRDDTLRGLRSLADRSTRFEPLYLLLARLYLEHNRADDAAVISMRAMELFPHSGDAARLASAALAAAERWNELLGVAGQWRQRSAGQSLAADMMLATAHLNLNQPSRAGEQLMAYVPLAAADPEAFREPLVLLARCLLRTGQVEQAENLLSAYLARNAGWREAWITLASAEVRDPVLAARWLDRVAHAMAPAAIDEQAALAYGWHALSRRSGSPTQKEKANAFVASLCAQAESASFSNTSLLRLAMIRDMDGAAEEAGRLYRLCLKHDPPAPLAMNNLATLILKQDGDLAEAERLAAGAVAASPRVPNFHDTLAGIYARRGDAAKALTHIAAAMELEPQRLLWRINQAQLLVDSGKKDQARKALQSLETLAGRASPEEIRMIERIKAAVQ